MLIVSIRLDYFLRCALFYMTYRLTKTLWVNACLHMLPCNAGRPAGSHLCSNSHRETSERWSNSTLFWYLHSRSRQISYTKYQPSSKEHWNRVFLMQMQNKPKCLILLYIGMSLLLLLLMLNDKWIVLTDWFSNTHTHKEKSKAYRWQGSYKWYEESLM